VSCQARREGDELVCSACGLRWGVGEFAPRCNAEVRRAARVLVVPGARLFVDGKEIVEVVKPLPPGGARKLLDDLKAKLSESPGAKWKERK
jgi:hypothetical protein